jgi:hypothetical protein
VSLTIKKPCPICGLNVPFKSTSSGKTLNCGRCGEYHVSEELLVISIPLELRPYLSAAARQGSDNSAPILLNQSNLEDIAANHRSVTTSRKVDKVLHYIAAKCRQPGVLTGIDFDLDYPAANCRDGAELLAYVEYLIERALLKKSTAGNLSNVTMYSPTIAGWQAIEPSLPIGGEPDRCFVAMWFADEMDDVYELGFRPAIVECGFKVYRIKEDPTNKGIADKVLSEIRRARFVVCDFTGERTSVYYEAGFAHGLGREVIGCCREGAVSNLTFDTRHLGHVVWKDAADLRQKLADSIRANIIPKR